MSTYYEPPVTVEASEVTGARWAELVEPCWPGVRVIWAHGHYDYQGDATILGLLPDGQYLVCEWSYGSCSGCDPYEGIDPWDRPETAGPSDQLKAEFAKNGTTFTREALTAYGSALPEQSKWAWDPIIPTDLTLAQAIERAVSA